MFNNILIILAQFGYVVCDGSIMFSCNASGNRIQRLPHCYVVQDPNPYPEEPWPGAGLHELGLPNIWRP